MFSVVGVEYVQGAVVCRVLRVVQEVLHLHVDNVAVVVFATLEILVTVFLGKTLGWG